MIDSQARVSTSGSVGCALSTTITEIVFWLPETLPEEKRVKASLPSAFRNYLALLKNTKFMRFTLCLTFYYVAAYWVKRRD